MIIIRIVRNDTVQCLGTTVHKLDLVGLCGIDGCSMVAPVWAASRAMQDGTTSTGTPVLQYVSTVHAQETEVTASSIQVTLMFWNKFSNSFYKCLTGCSVALDPIQNYCKSLVHTGHYSVPLERLSTVETAEVEGEITKLHSVLRSGKHLGPAGIYRTQPRTGPTPTGTRLQA